MTVSTTRTGSLVGAVLALCWIILGFWAFAFVAVAMGIGALVGRIVEGKLNVAGLVDAFSGKRSAS